MPYRADVVKVMIASPGDVGAERLAATATIHEWNAVHSGDRSMVLLPILWETHSSPAMGARAQEIINRQLVRDADLMVAMFWTRVGTSTGAAASGTIEEIEEHLKAGKPVMLYFSTAPVRLDSVDEQQYSALRQFKEWARSNGLFEEFDSLEQFREKFGRQLAQTMIRTFPRNGDNELTPPPIERSPSRVRPDYVPQQASGRSTQSSMSLDDRNFVSSLSDDAQMLLIDASKDRNGTVLVTETFGGTSVETNEKNFIVKEEGPRSEARWRRAVRDLLALSLLEQRDTQGEVFSLTDEGYRFADLLER